MTINELKEAYDLRRQAQLACDAAKFEARVKADEADLRAACAKLRAYRGITELGLPRGRLTCGRLI